MTAPAPDGGAAAVAVELAQLRGEISTGLAEIQGTLRVLLERTTRTDADLQRHREETDKELKALHAKVDALEDRRFPLPVIGALGTVGALLLTVIGLLISR